MPRRNNIAKILIFIASCLPLAMIAVACPPPLFPTYKVPTSFQVVLKSQSQPMSGVKVNLYREEGANNLTRRLLSALVTDADGNVKIQNLDPGRYFVETTGQGAGDAAHLIVQAAGSSDVRDAVELQWPARTPLRTKALTGRIFSSDPLSSFTNVKVAVWTKDSAAAVETINAGPSGEFALKANEPGLYFLYVTASRRDSRDNKEVPIAGDFPVIVNADSDSQERLTMGLVDTECGLLVAQPWNSPKPEQDASKK